MSKNVFLTGASSGIGKFLALELARRGYHLALTARRQAVLEEVKAEIAKISSSAKVETFALDVTDPEAVFKVFEQAAAAMNGIDIAIANAGVAHMGKVGKLDFAKVRSTIDTNITGAFATVDAAIEHFQAKGSGHVVGVASVAGFRGLPTSAAYSASKAALIAYMEALRMEQRGKGITVTTLMPGYIDTPINDMMKNRPFLIGVEEGARQIANLIEKKVEVSTVPVMPWSVLGRVVKMAPEALLARAM